MMTPDFEQNTRTIRKWLRGGTISIDNLIAELGLWLTFWGDGNTDEPVKRADPTTSPAPKGAA